MMKGSLYGRRRRSIMILFVCAAINNNCSAFSSCEKRSPFVTLKPTGRAPCIQLLAQRVTPRASFGLASVKIDQEQSHKEAVAAVDKIVSAQDVKGLQKLFTELCTADDGLLTRTAMRQVPLVVELLKDGDLEMDEVDTLWNAQVAKFPDKDGIDMDAFVQLYRAIDDLFEEQEIAEEKAEDAALSASFQNLCGDTATTTSIDKATLRQWQEVDSLFRDNLFSLEEFNGLWTRAAAGKENDVLDKQGFVRFNQYLDELFEFEEVDDDDEATTSTIQTEEDAQSPQALFASLANDQGLVGRDELKQWQELQDMIKDGDLLPAELDEMYTQQQQGDDAMLDEQGFVQLYKAIDQLFEEVDDAEPVEEKKASVPVDAADKEDTTPNVNNVASLKEELMNAVGDLLGDDVLPCGLDANEEELKEVLSIVQDLERESSNFIRQNDASVDRLVGTWELIFSSSSAMKFNKGLSGLGGSVPNGQFGSLQQKLIATKYMMDVEYTEHIQVTPSSASFDVKVTGSWDLRESISLFTGEPSVVMAVEPDRVSYGPTSTKADHWKSLGPMNMLDITYLDDDLRIMRGNTSTDTVFVFKRCT